MSSPFWALLTIVLAAPCRAGHHLLDVAPLLCPPAFLGVRLGLFLRGLDARVERADWLLCVRGARGDVRLKLGTEAGEDIAEGCLRFVQVCVEVGANLGNARIARGHGVAGHG